MKPSLLKILKRARQELSGESWALVQAQLDAIAYAERKEEEAIEAYVAAKEMASLMRQRGQWSECPCPEQPSRALARAQAKVTLEYSWLAKGLRKLGCV